MANTNLFPRLKRLFSTDVVLRNVGGNQLKVFDINSIQQTGNIQTNALIDRFNRIYTNSGTSLYGNQINFNYQYLRPSLYSDYDAMDTDAIIASALDIVADESTLKNDMGEVLSIRSSDENIQKILYNLFYDVLNIEFNLWPWIRNMCKYGDFFLKLEIAEKYGVYNVIPYTAFHIERLEGSDPKNPSEVKFRFDPDGVSASSQGSYNVPGGYGKEKSLIFDNYEVAHFRLLTDVNFLPYGRCLHPSSRVYTENSYKEIKDIQKGDKVWTFNIKENKYELADVLNTVNSGIKEIYSIRTSHNEIKASNNHPVMIWNDSLKDVEYRQVKDLNVGDYIAHVTELDIQKEPVKLLKNNMELGPHDWKTEGKTKRQPKKLNTLNSSKNVELYKIKSITKDLPEETYDIQVSKNSNFIANGIIVHNSYIEPARKLFKQYTLMEDAMLIHRIVRAPEKRIFYMNVGSIPPNEIDAFMEKTLSKLKRTPYIDQQTGEYNLRYNMQNLLEDYYIPVRGNDTSTKIENLNGLQWDGIDDVNYLRDKLFAALKVPKAFMGYDENTDGKATLAAQDIRFARTIERIQRIITSELYKIALIHLYTQGYRDEQLSNFELSLTNPSVIYDQERVALMKEKMELAAQMMESQLFPTDFIYDNLFKLSEDQYDEYRDLVREDAKRKFRLSQISEEGNDPVETGKSYGTPHDLASLYGKGRTSSDPNNLPDGYDETSELGRPKEKTSDRNTQNDNFGKDRLGVSGMKNDYNSNKKLKVDFKGGSPLALENNNVNKHKEMLKNIPISSKVLVFESDKNEVSFLNEDNIKE